jgi:hypothetical protein
MAIVQVTVMRGPGNSANPPYPASYTSVIDAPYIHTRPYTGPQSGVNTVLVVRYSNDRSLNYKAVYYVNETVTQIKASIIGG